MNQEKYLRRLNISESQISPDLQNLKMLQRRHPLRQIYRNKKRKKETLVAAADEFNRPFRTRI